MRENLLGLLDKLDIEHAAVRATGAAAGPMANARAIVTEMRRLIRGDFDPRRDTSRTPKLDRSETEEGDEET